MSIKCVDHFSSLLPALIFVEDVTIPNSTVLLPGFLVNKGNGSEITDGSGPGPGVILSTMRESTWLSEWKAGLCGQSASSHILALLLANLCVLICETRGNENVYFLR